MWGSGSDRRRPPGRYCCEDALSLRGVSCDASTPYDRVVLIAEWPFAVFRHASIPPGDIFFREMECGYEAVIERSLSQVQLP